MGLAAVSSAAYLFLHTNRVSQLVLDCSYEEEQPKPKRYNDLKNASYRNPMDHSKSIDEMTMVILIYHILIQAFIWCGQNWE